MENIRNQDTYLEYPYMASLTYGLSLIYPFVRKQQHDCKRTDFHYCKNYIDGNDQNVTTYVVYVIECREFNINNGYICVCQVMFFLIITFIFFI